MFLIIHTWSAASANLVTLKSGRDIRLLQQVIRYRNMVHSDPFIPIHSRSGITA